MDIPLQLAFRGVEPSPAIELRVREHLERLHRFHREVGNCQVIVGTSTDKAVPPIYRISIDLTVRQTGVGVRTDDQHPEYADVYVALRDAFDGVMGLIRRYELIPPRTPRPDSPTQRLV